MSLGEISLDQGRVFLHHLINNCTKEEEYYTQKESEIGPEYVIWIHG